VLLLRRATPADLALILPRTLSLNAHEGITVAPDALEAALRALLADPVLCGVWLGERIVAPGGASAPLIDPPPPDPDDAPPPVDATATTIGYAIVTFGYDLEFAGRDAWLTELWIDDASRNTGAGGTALALLDTELRSLGVRALHLQVRPENPALRLYERAGFERSPRLILTRRLD
jgi:ribosomal protein S18 acetylase RimI-like enzyme